MPRGPHIHKFTSNPVKTLEYPQDTFLNQHSILEGGDDSSKYIMLSGIRCFAVAAQTILVHGQQFFFQFTYPSNTDNKMVLPNRYFIIIIHTS